MYYRRKIFLALVEAFDGKLARTDFQKLLFLFCQRTGRNYYDFFPYRFGGFSQVSYQDKRRLTDLGYLAKSEDVELCQTGQYAALLKPNDRTAICNLVDEIGILRGQKLVRKVYLEFPHYTVRSEIATDVLSNPELDQTKKTWNIDNDPCLFTLGYEGITIDAFLNALISNNISALVDVRKNPVSMKYGFSKKRLSEYVQHAGLTYYHLPELGIPSQLRRELNNPADYQTLFTFYAKEILPYQHVAIETLKLIQQQKKRIAITCFEANPQFCHRGTLACRLEQDSEFFAPIVHLSLSKDTPKNATNPND